MDKFEKLIKETVEGYEAPFNPQAWDQISGELGDSFEHMVKESAESYQAPYNPAAWDAVNSQLGPANNVWKWIGGSAAVITIVAGVSYLNSDSSIDNEISNYTSQEVIIDQPNHQNNNTIVMNDDNTVNNEIVADNNIVDNSNNTDHQYNQINTENNNNTYQVNPVDVDDNETSLNTQETSEDGSTQTNTVKPDDINVGNDNSGLDQNQLVIKASAKFNMSQSEICQNGKCEFTPKRTNENLIYIWNFGDGEVAQQINATHKYKKAGEYTVTLQVKDPKTNKLLDTQSDMITVHKLPEVEFSWSQSTEAIPTYKFENTTYNGDVVMWNIKGLKQSNNADFEYTFRKAGTYAIELSAKNEYGCINKGNRKIEVKEDYNLLAPTAFSPNGDGNYDNFIPLALTVLDADFTMTIFDKSGKQVYWTRNAFEPWDGKYTEDNTLAPNQSSFIWRVELINNNGEKEFYEGQVFVIY
ncbi:PKD domain-containing protein [Paracrocinitomix mangrovi]|uniref:PKD domain-containing protein n=1 Tax=Paracrocinitomix mangrovi TaxID=2862509 RepID=UPI001C8D298F|nr:PKD domain-containing protein [Paracrocinitomix mangrovi]UKN01823.1 PKD domain-containing protein [Paracrocinitomix mangrovi]